MKPDKRSLHFLVLLLFVCLGESSKDDTITPHFLKDQMYSYHFGAPCVRLIGREGPIGCSTSRTGTTGWLYPIETQQDLVELNTSPPSGDVVIVLPSEFFVPEKVSVIKGAVDLKGILVLKGPGPENFSPDAKYPNKQYGLYPNSTMEWNPTGSAWNFEQQDISIFLLDEDESKTMLEHAQQNKNSSHYPKWAVTMTAWMFTEHDTTVETCMRRGNCLPLGGRNIWGSFNLIGAQINQPLILATASFDSNAFFHDLAVGADADISGTIALLGAIQALSAVPRDSWIRQPVFVFFTGESYGFIGSKSFVKDISNFTCLDPRGSYCEDPYRLELSFQNLHLDMIESILEVNQIGHFVSGGNDTKLYFHTDSQSGGTEAIRYAVEQGAIGTNVQVETPNLNQELPPSSLMSFLEASRSLSGAVLTDHRREYVNPYFHSRFDDLENINLDRICQVSLVIARTLFLQGINATETEFFSIDDLQVHCPTVVALFSCFTVQQDCQLAYELYPQMKVSGTLPPPTNYVGVYSRKSYNFITGLLYDWLINATATQRSTIPCNETSYCVDNNWGDACLSGECISGFFISRHEALSPAFKYSHENGRMELVDDSPQYPLWTESYWQPPSMTLFQMDAPWLGPVVFGVGMVEFIVCLVIVKLSGKIFSRYFKLV